MQEKLESISKTTSLILIPNCRMRVWKEKKYVLTCTNLAKSLKINLMFSKKATI